MAFRCTHGRRRGPDVRDYEHRSKRGERGIRLARNDACFVDNGVAGGTVRALPRPTQDQGEPSLVDGELPLSAPTVAIDKTGRSSVGHALSAPYGAPGQSGYEDGVSSLTPNRQFQATLKG